MATATNDPDRLVLAQALGLAHACRRLLRKIADTARAQECLAAIEKEIGLRLDSLPLQKDLGLKSSDNRQEVRPGWWAEELAWRKAEVWKAHVRAWKEWRRRANGVGPTREPFLHPADIQEPIVAALQLHDADLLAPEDRDRWLRDSRVRAAGIGLFYDSWCTGEFKNGDRPPDSWSGPYVEHWRPWKRLRGKPDPVLKFSELYFEQRDIVEADHG